MDCGVPGAAKACGSLTWLLSRSIYRPYVKGSCQNGAAFSSFTSADTCLCPAAAAISPCSCFVVQGSQTDTAINCTSAGLNDTGIAAITQRIQTDFSPYIVTFLLNGNQLTRVPQGLAQFVFLSVVDLSSNAIESVASGDLALPAPVEAINLAGNKIQSIEPSSLPGACDTIERSCINQQRANGI